ncbi:MAG: hypothetical protein AAB403_10650 [Planctomycetota bacterium]
MINEQMKEHYAAVLRDLEVRRAQCQRELTELEQIIGGIRKQLSVPISVGSSLPNVAGKFANMSVRWAILNLLAEESTAPMTTPAVADALRLGGISSDGKNFNSNVSAVLSTMANERKEVESTEHGYVITQHGRQVWESIKASPKWQNRASSNGS